MDSMDAAGFIFLLVVGLILCYFLYLGMGWLFFFLITPVIVLIVAAIALLIFISRKKEGRTRFVSSFDT